MKGNILVGTVRAHKGGDEYIVASRDGVVHEMLFSGGEKPLIGGDVLGNVSVNADGRSVLSLKASLTDAMLVGGATIMLAGARPDMTARLLAKYLARSKAATIAPGSGMTIHRRPHTPDVDLQWALDRLSPAADKRQIALNVIDVKAISKAVWQTASLRDFALPADIEGNKRSMLELTRVLRSGFHPECSRMIENYSGNREISVNFVMPYSPFSGALGFARDVAWMGSGYFPFVDMTISDSRKLSSARMIGLAMAHNVLAVGERAQADVEQSARTKHLANSFADALATLAYLSDGGNVNVCKEYADLRESSLCFGYDTGRWALFDGVREEATHRSIRGAIQAFERKEQGSAWTPEDLIASAVRAARKFAFPAALFDEDHSVSDEEMNRATEAANRVAADLRPGDEAVREPASARYMHELQQLAEEHGNDKLSASRMVMYGGLNMPYNMDREFDFVVRDLSPVSEQAEVPTSSPTDILKSRIADRVRQTRRLTDPRPVYQVAEPFKF